MDLYSRAGEAAQALRDHGALDIGMGLILGSGLAAIAETLAEAKVVPYEKIPNFPRTSVSGHPGKIFLGTVGPVKILALQGRVHYYEGFPMDVVTFPVRVMKLLKIPTLLLTCAAGGLDPRFRSAKMMLIQDHINLMGINPLRGEHDERWGTRFVDMSNAYDPVVLNALQAAGSKAQINVRKGVYAALPGPSYETPAEIKMLQTLGVNAVGMSTVPEVIVANQMGLRVGAIASITNLAAGLSKESLSHEEVEREAGKGAEDLKKLFSVAIPGVAHAVNNTGR